MPIGGVGGSTGGFSWGSILPALIQGGLGLTGAAIQSNATGSAASQQAAAAQQAAQLQYQLGQQALGLQATGMQQQQQNIQPWLNQGGGALNQLAYLMGVNPGNGQLANPATSGGLNPSNPGPPPGTGPGAGPAPPLANPITNPGNPNPPRVDVGGDVNLGQLLGWFNNPYGVPGAQTNPDSTGGGGINFAGGTTLNPAGGGTAGNPLTAGASAPATPWQPNTALGSFGSLSQPYGQTFTPPTWDQHFQGPTWNQQFQAPTWNEQFHAPTADEVRNTPGYQFELEQGLQSADRNAAARGTVLGGGQLKELERYGTNFADTKYGEAYNRAAGEYGQRYNEFLNKYQQKSGEYGQQYNQFLNNYQQQAGQYGQNYQQFLNNYGQQLGQYQMGYNQYEQQHNQLYNQLASLAGVGQTAAGQLNSSLGANAQNTGNLLTQIGQTQANGLNNAAYQNALGGVAGGNIWGNAISSLGPLLAQIFNRPGAQPVCWIAEALYGVDDKRTHLMRAWLNTVLRFDKERGWIVKLYEMYGERTAELVKAIPEVRAYFAELFASGLKEAEAWEAANG